MYSSRLRRMSRAEADDGSIVITVLVIIVATGLVAAFVALGFGNLRQSRRAGDSANALQVADGGVSNAVANASHFEKATSTPAAPPPPGYTCSTAGGVRRCTGTVTVGGSQASVVAERDPDATTPVWHIVSTGSDSVSAQRRRVRADAVSTLGPSIGLFVQADMQLAAGTEVDSYKSTTQTCTGLGYVGTNSASTMTLGTSGTSGNCRGTSWGYYYDGCVSYADVNPTGFPSGSGCPPEPPTKRQTPAFVPETVYPPPGVPGPQPGGPCTATNPIVGGNSYYWTSVQLHDGCRVAPNPTTGSLAVKIVTPGDVDLGSSGGGGATINSPVGNPTCTAPGGNVRYCPSWVSNLQISVVSSDPGTNIRINQNNTEFWGVINAPTANLTACSGCPQAEFWGSFIFAKAQAPVQLSIHYDEALAGTTIGRFERRNWVQEPA